MKKIFTPFESPGKRNMLLLLAGQLLIALFCWQSLATGLIPTPVNIGKSLAELAGTRLFWDNIIISLMLTMKAMGISLAITLLISYASLIPFFRSMAELAVKCRYLTLTGLIFVFTLLTSEGSQLKISLLSFGIVPFFTTSFLSVILHSPKEELDLCRTLGYSPWQSLKEVIIVGKADQVLEIMRQNFAIAWLMITLVEGLNMSEGGIGTLLIKYNKYNDISHVLALQVVLFAIGIGFDFTLSRLRFWLFPYTRLNFMK